MSSLTGRVKELARSCGFELAGVARALPSADFERFQSWREAGCAGEMKYLTDRRGDLRADPRHLLPNAKSIVCVGKLYNTDSPSTMPDPDHGWIARYAQGQDYHDVLRRGLEQFVHRLQAELGQHFEWKICVDTAPLLERSYSRLAGLGWIGKNTCLINEQQGSWFLLGEVLLSLDLDPDTPPSDRCGTCTRCIDACPTSALVPDSAGGWTLDARRCISYLTIENRGPTPAEFAARSGNMIFGCDICQDVCPWNRRAPSTEDPLLQSTEFAPALAEIAEMLYNEFKQRFRNSAVNRAKYSGLLRNVAIALSNSDTCSSRSALERLAQHPDPLVAETAANGLATPNKEDSSE